MRILFQARSIRPRGSCGHEYFLYSLLQGWREHFPQDDILLNVRADALPLFRAELGDAGLTYMAEPPVDPDRAFGPGAIGRFAERVTAKISPRFGEWREQPLAAWTRQCEAHADVVVYTYQRDPIAHRHRPCILVMHDFREFELPGGNAHVQRLQRRNLRRASAVVTSWPGPAATLRKRFPEVTDKSFTIPFCFEPQPTNEDAQSVVEPNLLVYASSNDRHKNHDTLIRALGILKRRGRAPVRVMCPGTLLPGRTSEVADLVQREHVEDWIEFLGFVERDVVRDLYRRAFAVVSPTRYEALSGAVLEGLQYGKPLICSDIPSTRLFLQSLNVDARYFDVDNPVSAANAIDAVLSDPVPYVRAAQHGRARVAVITRYMTVSRYRDVVSWACARASRPAWQSAPFDAPFHQVDRS